MSNKLKLAIFDCDGTLVDGQHMIISSMKRPVRSAIFPILVMKRSGVLLGFHY